MNEPHRTIETLERRIAVDADDGASRYRLAVLLLDEYRTNDADMLRSATRHLERAVEIRPMHARSHATLGYANDLAGESAEQALARFREARRLDPDNREYDVYVATLLEETGREGDSLAEIERAAPRHGVDLVALRRELAAAGMPADARSLLMNGFIHARNFFRSSLADEAERIRNVLQPGRARTLAARERARCIEHQRELERRFDPAGVPESLRALAGWASRYGLGDDVCRPALLQRLSRKQRTALILAVDRRAEAIQAWLDSFTDATLSAEASALMYLALGVEEIREPGGMA